MGGWMDENTEQKEDMYGYVWMASDRNTNGKEYVLERPIQNRVRIRLAILRGFVQNKASIPVHFLLPRIL